MASESIAQQTARRLGSGSLTAPDGRAYELVITDLSEVRPRTGWLRFALTIRAKDGRAAQTALMAGIISGGGRGVMPWMEVRIFPTVEFHYDEQFDAREAGLEAAILKLIGTLIPAGGHLMIEYESPGQSETHRGLLLRVPPAATHLGALMFEAGFRGHFKDWYISEGGHEGPRKLQANKSPNEIAAQEALSSNLEELEQFINRPLPDNAEDAGVIARAQDRARLLLNGFS